MSILSVLCSVDYLLWESISACLERIFSARREGEPKSERHKGIEDNVICGRKDPAVQIIQGLFLIGIMLIGLFVPALTLTSYASNSEVKSSDLKTSAIDSQSSHGAELTDLGKAGSQDSGSLALDPNGCARLIVGVGTSKNSVQGLEGMIAREGANITDRISIEDNVKALAVEVSPQYSFFLAEQLQTSGLASYVEPDARVNVSYVPNDPYWAAQWGPTKIEADKALDTTNGSSSILVAIVDTGIDYTHPDLAANYVPLGYNWVSNNSNVLDDFGHGTHCAGIVAAVANNGIGVAGLAQVHIMAEKVLSAAGWGWDSWVAEGIVHAADVGANIISLSLGSTTWSDLMYYAVNYARQHGVLIIAGAGNNGNDQMFYPAAYDGVMAVSATDSNDALASFSNFGNWIDVAAPGVSILSTMPTYHVTMNDLGYGMNYTYASGTSMACPFVAGVAALAWSEYRDCPADQIRWILENTADKLGYEGLSEQFGHGRINARRAVTLPDHDLGIAELEHPHRVSPGSECEFNATVGNYGRENETNVCVQFFVNDTLIESSSISFLEDFSSTTVLFMWNTTVLGDYDVSCNVVPVQGENSTQNNVVHCSIIVRFPLTLRVRTDYQTINEALNNSGEGDTILVSEGYYDEGEIDVRVNNVTLAADGTVVIDGQHAFCAIRVMADFITIKGFDIRNCPHYGLMVHGDGDALTGNSLIGNGEYGQSLRVYGSTRCTISLNYVEASSDGVYVISCSNSTITSNRLVAGSRYSGMHFSSCFNDTISCNYLMNVGACWDGLDIVDSEDNVIASNIMKSFSYGLVLSASNNLLRNNTMIDNYCNFCPWGSMVVRGTWTGPNTVDASNTANGKPICYWVNASNQVVPSSVACVTLVNCENITVENQELMNNNFGVFTLNSSSILIQDNNFTANSGFIDPFCSGVFTSTDSYNITVTQNNVTRNDNGVILFGFNSTVDMNIIANSLFQGIRISDNDTVTRNNITWSEGFGVYIDGVGSTVTMNNIMANAYAGIFATGSNHTITLNNMIAYAAPDIWTYEPVDIMLEASNCTIVLNNFVNSGGSAILTQNGPWSNNTIFHNNFVNNYQDLQNVDHSVNSWDAGPLLGGNYWSSYNGTDTDGDGIGDTPYFLDSNDTDNYPLMQPVAENPPPQTFTLRTIWVGNSTEQGYYERPMPPPGKYLFMENSTIHVDMLRDGYTATVDDWELDGVNISSSESVNVFMNANHTVVLYMHEPPPLNVSISPTNVKTYAGGYVPFNSSLSGGKAPYDYQWWVNGSIVWDATTPTWAFQPEKAGVFNVTLTVMCPSYYISHGIKAAESNVAWANVSSIGVAAVTPSKTEVGRGYLMNVSVTVVNPTDSSETCNVTLYANTIRLVSDNIVMPSGSYANLIYAWNTTGYSYGNYTISAYSSVVQAENNIVNSLCVSDVGVHLGVPGDVSSSSIGVYDGVTNMKDIAYMVSLFNTNLFSSNWNANADVNNDGVCNMKDIAIAVLYFNQHE